MFTASGVLVHPNSPVVREPLFTILVDHACPLCRAEGRLLARLDRGRGRLQLIDISDPEFDAGAFGTDFESVMGEIHGVTADGSLVMGVEVFRRAYDAVGWGWVWGPTRWPVLRSITDASYRWFARHRLSLTGRRGECASGRCRI